jgi:hypothetical protein
MMVVLFRKSVFSLNNNSHRGALAQAAVLKTGKKYGDFVERYVVRQTLFMNDQDFLGVQNLRRSTCFLNGKDRFCRTDLYGNIAIHVIDLYGIFGSSQTYILCLLPTTNWGFRNLFLYGWLALPCPVYNLYVDVFRFIGTRAVT